MLRASRQTLKPSLENTFASDALNLCPAPKIRANFSDILIPKKFTKQIFYTSELNLLKMDNTSSWDACVAAPDAISLCVNIHVRAGSSNIDH